MIEAAIRDFALCRTERDFYRLSIKLEDRLTPVEIAALAARAGELPWPAQGWLKWLLGMMPLAAERPQAFERSVVNPEVVLYRDQRVGAARKKLIVAFCGARNRLDMPLAAVLQALPSRAVDVAVMRDRSRRHFLDGITGYAPGFAGLVAAIERDLRPGKYREAYAYGTSMGGFAAVRFALLRPVRRAVAVGGSFPGHARRLTDDPAQQLPAFDPLCDCVGREAGADIVCVYGEDCGRDRRNAEWLGHIMPATQVAVPHVSIHNVAHELAISGRLAAFFAAMFDLDAAPPAVREGWLTLPARVALPIVSAA